MWEDLKVYKQLDKAAINFTFKKFGSALVSLLSGYSLEQTTSIIKLSRQVGQLEQAVFIEKSKGAYDLKVHTSIKPVDFYRLHKFTMLNIISLGDILNNHRRTFYPLTEEWNDLAVYLAARISTDIEKYFMKYNSYDKIIERRKEIEPKDFAIGNKYELLIYAAIKTKRKDLLIHYIDKKINRPVMSITQSEYQKPDSRGIDEYGFLERIKSLALNGNFSGIDKEIEAVVRMK